MIRLTAFVFCIAFLFAAGGWVLTGMALGAAGFAVGCLAIACNAWKLLSN
jgi:hypothetical protein